MLEYQIEVCMIDEIKTLITKMTLEEKAGLCSGYDFWSTKPVKRLGIPSVCVSDGPHGLRKENDDDNGNAFPIVKLNSRQTDADNKSHC